MAAAIIEVHCPQCGADTPARDHVATACGQCDTLLVSLGGSVRRAAGFEGHLPREGDTVALVCRLCGGALPDEVLKAGTGARCTYCGERADLPPTMVSMLRAMVTHPKAVPLAALRISRFWLGSTVAFIAVVLIYMFTPDTSVRNLAELPLASPELVRTEGDTRYYRLQAQSPPVTLQPRGNLRPSLHLLAYDYPPGPGVNRRDLITQQHVQMLATLVREGTGERRDAWLAMYQGEAYSTEKEYYPKERLHAPFYLDDGLRSITLPTGTCHIEIRELVIKGGGAPPSHFIVEWNTSYSDLNGWFIFAANILGWCFIMDLRRLAYSKLGDDSRWFGWTQAVAIVVMLLLLVESIKPFDPLGNKTTFNAKELPSKVQPPLPGG